MKWCFFFFLQASLLKVIDKVGILVQKFLLNFLMSVVHVRAYPIPQGFCQTVTNLVLAIRSIWKPFLFYSLLLFTQSLYWRTQFRIYSSVKCFFLAINSIRIFNFLCLLNTFCDYYYYFLFLLLLFPFLWLYVFN